MQNNKIILSSRISKKFPSEIYILPLRSEIQITNFDKYNCFEILADCKNILVPVAHLSSLKKLERRMSEVEIRRASDKQLETIEAMLHAVLREVFDFEDGTED